MPPVSLENFNKRVAEMKKKEEDAALKQVFKCPYTGKVFKSEGAWKNYISSKKYQELEKKQFEKHGNVLSALKPNSIEKKRVWKDGDSPQKRWMYKMYIRSMENEDNWEDDDDDSDDDMEENVQSSSKIIKYLEKYIKKMFFTTFFSC